MSSTSTSCRVARSRGWRHVAAADDRNGGHVVVVPTPTPEPSNWHMPMDCTARRTAPARSSGLDERRLRRLLRGAAGWLEARSNEWRRDVVTTLTVSYADPRVGPWRCPKGLVRRRTERLCAGRHERGTAMFGGREGQLFTGAARRRLCALRGPRQVPILDGHRHRHEPRCLQGVDGGPDHRREVTRSAQSARSMWTGAWSEGVGPCERRGRSRRQCSDRDGASHVQVVDAHPQALVEVAAR